MALIVGEMEIVPQASAALPASSSAAAQPEAKTSALQRALETQREIARQHQRLSRVRAH